MNDAPVMWPYLQRGEGSIVLSPGTYRVMNGKLYRIEPGLPPVLDTRGEEIASLRARLQAAEDERDAIGAAYDRLVSAILGETASASYCFDTAEYEQEAARLRAISTTKRPGGAMKEPHWIRELAAQFYLKTVSGTVSDWVYGVKDVSHDEVDQDVRDLAVLLEKVYERGRQHGRQDAQENLQPLTRIIAELEDGKCESLDELVEVIRQDMLLESLKSSAKPVGYETPYEAQKRVLDRMARLLERGRGR